MPGLVDSERPQTADRLAREHARRLRWRHVLPLLVALAVLTVSAGEIAAAFSTYAARHFAGVSRAKAESRLPLFVLLYVAAALVASLSISRFDPLRALRRLPFVVVFGAIGVAFMLLAMRVASLVAGAGGEDTVGGDPATSLDSTAGRRRPQAGTPNLAAALVDEDAAALALGRPAALAQESGGRSGSTCSYRATDGSAQLTVAVREGVPRAFDSRLEKRGELVAGLGDRAYLGEQGLWVSANGWLLILARERTGRPLERDSLVEAARRAVDRLPTGPLERHQTDRELLRGTGKSVVGALRFLAGGRNRA